MSTFPIPLASVVAVFSPSTPVQNCVQNAYKLKLYSQHTHLLNTNQQTHHPHFPPWLAIVPENSSAPEEVWSLIFGAFRTNVPCQLRVWCSRLNDLPHALFLSTYHHWNLTGWHPQLRGYRYSVALLDSLALASIGGGFCSFWEHKRKPSSSRVRKASVTLRGSNSRWQKENVAALTCVTRLGTDFCKRPVWKK